METAREDLTLTPQKPAQPLKPQLLPKSRCYYIMASGPRAPLCFSGEGIEPEGLSPLARTQPRLTGHSGQHAAQPPITGMKPLLPAEKKGGKKRKLGEQQLPRGRSHPRSSAGFIPGTHSSGVLTCRPKNHPQQGFPHPLPQNLPGRSVSTSSSAGSSGSSSPPAWLHFYCSLPALSNRDTHLQRVRLRADRQERPSFPAAGKGSCRREKQGSVGINQLLTNQTAGVMSRSICPQ